MNYLIQEMFNHTHTHTHTHTHIYIYHHQLTELAQTHDHAII